MAKEFRYGDTPDGDRNTIHASTDLNVEVDKHGIVVAVWFRCIALPFDQTVVDGPRAREMRHAYADGQAVTKLHAVIIDDPKEN